MKSVIVSATLLLLGSLLPFAGTHAGTPDPLARVLALPKASLMLEEKGQLRIARQADRPMIPASTMKLLTALAAIDRWGLDHRFYTDFHVTRDHWLWIQGQGDPYLVSEELDAMIQVLKRQGLKSIAGIGLDDSLFSPTLEILGRSSSSNPYDAPVTALAVNFNTVAVRKQGGKVQAAEPQTPLTPIARALGQGLGPGLHRINLRNRETAVRYFGELFAAKLVMAGISATGSLRLGQVPIGARRILRHENRRTLREVLASMLKYSSNFVANDLFVLLAGGRGTSVLDMPQARRVAQDWAARTFSWRGHRIEDGAGLARTNQLSARQLLEVVKAFAPYRTLLPEHRGQVYAKTGTLTGVSSYAGFVRRGQRWEPFSLLINQPVDHNLRLRVAEALATLDNVSAYCPGASC